MKNLDINKFEPKKVELVELSDKYKNLEIKGVDDKDGYSLVDVARKNLKSKRVEITKTGKAMRDDALKFQRAVIAKEKELVGIIEPVEIELKKKQASIDEEREKISRIELLPNRKKWLKAIDVEMEDDFILLMDDAQYEAFYNKKNAIFLDKKAQKLKEKEDKIAREKEIEDAKKQARIDAEKQAKIDADNAKIKAEQDKQRAIQKEKDKAEKEKQRIIQEQKNKEQAIKDEEYRKKEEQEQLEKKKKYVKFLKDNGWTEKNKQEFHTVTENGVVTLYKKLGEFKI